MGENTKIEWADDTWNPWIGCQKVAAGCTHCYAESFAKRTGKAKWGEGGTRVKTSEKNWGLPVKWNKAAEAAGLRRRVFCASMADVFEDWAGEMVDHRSDKLLACESCGHVGVDDCELGFWEQGTSRDGDGWVYACPACDAEPVEIPAATMNDLRRKLFELIDSTPWLDWLLLTKRPENIRRMWPSAAALGGKCPSCKTHEGVHGGCDCGLLRAGVPTHRRNVWLLTSVAEQKDADANIPELLKCRDLCPVLGVSAEPLIGSVNFPPNLDWVIVGGESGHGARPMHPQWARSLRNQCQAAGVPFLFKQWGEWQPVSTTTGIQILPFGNYDASTGAGFNRKGKKASGRLLDGREWNQFPKGQA